MGGHNATSAKEQHPAACGADSCRHRGLEMDLLVKGLTIPPCSSVAWCLRLPQPRSRRASRKVGAGELKGSVQKCKVLANLTEANAAMMGHAVAHVKEHRISVNTPGFTVQAGEGHDAEIRGESSLRNTDHKYTQAGGLGPSKGVTR